MPTPVLPPLLANQVVAGGDAVDRLCSVVKVSGSRKIKSQE